MFTGHQKFTTCSKTWLDLKCYKIQVQCDEFGVFKPLLSSKSHFEKKDILLPPSEQGLIGKVLSFKKCRGFYPYICIFEYCKALLSRAKHSVYCT